MLLCKGEAMVLTPGSHWVLCFPSPGMTPAFGYFNLQQPKLRAIKSLNCRAQTKLLPARIWVPSEVFREHWIC